MSVLEGLFPEVGAGGFTRMEPRIQFYSRVRALLEPNHHVLDFGAGRGKFHYLESDPLKRITDISRIPARYALLMSIPLYLRTRQARIDMSQPWARACLSKTIVLISSSPGWSWSTLPPPTSTPGNWAEFSSPVGGSVQ